MARTLKLDILVDDHGGVRTLRNVADAERDVAREAGHAGTAMGAFGTFVSQAAASFTAFVAADVVLRGLRATVEFATRAAFGMNAELETSTLQFETLMGSSAKAEAHVKGLFEFAKRTPFETGPIIEASRILQVMGGEALNTQATLQMLGDSAAATAAPLDELARWTGRFYAALQGGQPIGEATRRLMELGVLSPQAVEHLRALSEGGGKATEAFKFFTEELERHEGAMAKQAGTWQGLVSTFVDGAQIAIAEAFEPLFNAVKAGLGAVNAAIESPAFQAAIDRVAESMRQLFSQEHIVAFAQQFVSVVQLILRGVDALQTAFNALQAGIAQVFVTAFEWIAQGAEAVFMALSKIPGATYAFSDQLIQLGLVMSTSRNLVAGFSSVLHDQEEDYRRNANTIESLVMGLESIKSAIPSVVSAMETKTATIERQTAAVQRLTSAEINFAQVTQATLAGMGGAAIGGQGGMFPIAPWGEMGTPAETAAAAAAGSGGGGGGGYPGYGGGGGGYPGYGGGGGGGQGPYFLPDYGKPVYGAGGLLGYQSQNTPVGMGTTVNIDAKGAIFESEAVLTRLADKVASKLAGRYGQGALI